MLDHDLEFYSGKIILVHGQCNDFFSPQNNLPGPLVDSLVHLNIRFREDICFQILKILIPRCHLAERSKACIVLFITTLFSTRLLYIQDNVKYERTL